MKQIFVIFLLSFFIFVGCKNDETSIQKKERSKLKVLSVNYPLHYFAQRIGGNHIDAIFPISTDGDPAYWKPDEASIGIYQQADLIILNGAGYAKWINKVSLPASKMFDTSKNYKERLIELDEGMTHSHGPEGEHVHKGYAFTTWLNLKLAIEQASAIADRLNQLLPEAKESFEMNLQDLLTDLGILDRELTTVAKNLENHNLFGSHPVYQYLANGYGLTIRSEHWEPDQKITKEQWIVFKDKLKKHPGKIMIWEDQPLEEVEKKLISKDIRVVVFNPCGNKPDTGDFISVMKSNIENLKAAL
jgi:zinc transport system substrate-binding protein